MFTVNHDVVNKRFIMHSWAGADGVATAEEKQKEKDYNAKYYQEHKKTVGNIRNSAPASQPTTPSPTPSTPAQPAAQSAQSSGKKKTSSGRSIGTKPKIDDDIVQASATHKRTEGDRDFDDSYKTEENRVVKNLDMFTHKTDDGNTVFVLGDNKWYLPKGIDLTDADKKLLSDLWKQPNEGLPDTKEHVMELFLQAKMQTARNGQKKKKSEKTEDAEKKTTSKKSSTKKKTSTKKAKKKTDNTEEESTVNTTETPTSSSPIAKRKTYEDYLPDAYEKQKLKHFDDSDESDFIAHFGVMGQQHGVQNGPPYPLGSGDHSAREVLFAEKAGIKVGQSSGKGSIENVKAANIEGSKSHRKKTDEELREDAMKAMIKADPKKIIKNIDRLSTQELNDAYQRVNYKTNIEKLIPEEDRKTKLQKDTERAANSANANEILRYSSYMTPQQLNDAITKMSYVNKLKDATKPKTTLEKIEDIADRAEKVKNIAEKGIGVWNVVAKVHNSTSKDGKSWPVINMNGGGQKNNNDNKNNDNVTISDLKKFAKIIGGQNQNNSKAGPNDNVNDASGSEAKAKTTQSKNQNYNQDQNNGSKPEAKNEFRYIKSDPTKDDPYDDYSTYEANMTVDNWVKNDGHNMSYDIPISKYEDYSPFAPRKNDSDDLVPSDEFLASSWDGIMKLKVNDYEPSNSSAAKKFDRRKKRKHRR